MWNNNVALGSLWCGTTWRRRNIKLRGGGGDWICGRYSPVGEKVSREAPEGGVGHEADVFPVGIVLAVAVEPDHVHVRAAAVGPADALALFPVLEYGADDRVGEIIANAITSVFVPSNL